MEPIQIRTLTDTSFSPYAYRTAWTASREEKKNKNKKFLLSTWRLLQRHFAYCCRTTSLHGFRYLVDPKCSKRERFMWACVVVAGVWATIYSLNSQVQLYYNNPIFYSSLATRKMIRDVPFPGITICSNNQIPPSAFNYSATVLKPRDQLTEQERFQLDFANYFCKFEDDTEYFYEHLNVSVIENIFQKKNNFCAEEFLEMVWKQRRLIEPCDFLQEVLTWYGHCYAFNMVSFHQFYQPDYVTWYLSPSAPTNTSSASMGGETKAFYKSDEVKSTDPGQRDIHSEDELPSTPWFTNDSSLLGGIMVTLNLRSHDFDNICSLGDKSFTVIVHPPDEVADWSHDSYTIQDNSITLIKLLPEVVEHSPMLETLPPAHRRCYVEGERELRFYKVYNQRNCETECHANLSLQHCGCVAYFHPRDKGTPVCNQAKSECLIQVQQAISERCNCLERCSGTRYNTEYFFINKKKRIHPDLDLTLLVVQFPRKRVMTKVADTIAGKIEVLSNLGGLLCLFLGAGLISLMEIVYFFSLRPLVTLWNYFRQAKKQTLSIGQLWSYGATRLVHRH